MVVLAPMCAPITTAARTLIGPVRALFHRELQQELAVIHQAGIPTLVLEPTLRELRVMGSNFMDPTRVLEISLQAAATTVERLTESEHMDTVDYLRHASRVLPRVEDVEYPA